MGTINPKPPRPHKIVNDDDSFFFIDCGKTLEVGTLISDNVGYEDDNSVWGNVEPGDYKTKEDVSYSVIINDNEESENYGRSEISSVG